MIARSAGRCGAPTRDPHRAAGRSRGYSLVEVLIALTLTGLVVAGILQTLSAQKRYYAGQARILDARHALRAASTILASELRETSPSGGDLYFLGPDSVGLRSAAGFGLICGIDGPSLALTRTSGHLDLQGSDSVLVFVEGSSRDDDDRWDAVEVTAISFSDTPACASGAAPERVMTLAAAVPGVRLGAPVRLFRAYVYGLFASGDDRWWLGRRQRSSSEYVPVAGPLAPPHANGLELRYRDADDQPVTDPGAVVRVEIGVRAPTSPTSGRYRDLTTSTYLRNDG